MEMLIFYVELVHELSPLIKYVIHQAVLWLTAKTPKPDTCWVGERREGRETPKTIPYVRLPDPLG